MKIVQLFPLKRKQLPFIGIPHRDKLAGTAENCEIMGKQCFVTNLLGKVLFSPEVNFAYNIRSSSSR